nr:three-Cys-motif partner protein TcmP [Candidatus Sigynarchaeota archaeon]
MVLRDDDDAKWVYQKHSRVKHEILTKYVGAFLAIVGRHWDTFFYIDAFAGRGSYLGGEPGSPTIAYSSIRQVLNKPWCKIKTVFLIYIEKNEANYFKLKKVVDILPPNPRIKIECLNSSFEDAFPSIITKHGAGLRHNPSFFFLDPFGYDDIPFEITERIFDFSLTGGRPEIFYTLMVGSINRFLDDPTKKVSFDKLFGYDEWQKDIQAIVAKAQCERPDAISRSFRDRLEKQTNAKFTLKYKFQNAETNAHIYDMVHATTQYKGLEVMKPIMYNIGVKGSYEFHGRQEKQLRGIKTLESFMGLKTRPGQPKLTDWLLTLPKDCPYTFEELKKLVIRYTREVVPGLREALKELQNRKKISVEKNSKKSKRGFADQDTITFL